MTYDNLLLAWKLLPNELWNTIYMVFVAAFFGCSIGVPLGILLVVTGRGYSTYNRSINRTLELLTNIGRSFPFAILLVALIPFTRWLIGTSLGTHASIIPLTVACVPFIARIVENALKGVPKEIKEASQVMGAKTSQLVMKVLLPESLPELISGLTLTIVNLIGLSAMAGLVGGGGLGQVAIHYGYNRFNGFIMTATVVLLVFLVQVVQWIGSFMVGRLEKKRGIIAS